MKLNFAQPKEYLLPLFYKMKLIAIDDMKKMLKALTSIIYKYICAINSKLKPKAPSFINLILILKIMH